MRPEDVPTIFEILDNSSALDMLTRDQIEDLIDELSNREEILRTDAIRHAVRITYNSL